MKYRIPIAAALLAVALFPAHAIAAEEAAAGDGSWLRLLFFVINFALFVSVLAYFAGPIVRTFFNDRAGAIRNTLSRADAAFREAQDLANRAAARIAGLAAEKTRIVSELDAETAHQVRMIAELARADPIGSSATAR